MFSRRLAPARRERLERALRRLLVAGEDRLMVVDLRPAERAAGEISLLGDLALPEPPKTVIL